MTTLEDRCVGLEQEFFLVDEDGILSNQADEFLDRCQEAAKAAGRDLGSYALECARSMVEINTPPVYSLEELSREYLTNLELTLDAGREQGLRLYPLATYPLHVEPVMRDDPHYQLQARAVGRERFTNAGRCASVHLHVEVARGTVDSRVGISYGSEKAARGAAEPLQPGDGVRRSAHSPYPLMPLLRGNSRRYCCAYSPLPRRPLPRSPRPLRPAPGSRRSLALRNQR